MIRELTPYKEDKELLRMLTDPVKKTEYTVRDALDEDIVYQMSLKSAESYLIFIWKMLHGLPLNVLEDSTDLEVTQYFYQNSNLWFRTEVTPLNSELFKGRFLSEVALHLANNLDKIVVDYVIHETKDIQVKSKMDMLDQIIMCFSQLARNMICDKSYSEESDKLFEMATICTDGGMKRRMRLINTYNDQMSILRDTTRNGFIGTDFMVEDSIIINNIILLAYMMVTEDPKAEGMFSISPDITFSDDTAVKRVVAKLGKSILDYKELVIESKRMRFAKKDPLAKLYEIFLRCKPLFSYRFIDLQKDECLREGCRALSYLGFLAQSKVVWTILGRMLY